MKFTNYQIFNKHNLFFIFLSLSSILFLYYLRQYNFFNTLKISLLFSLLLSPFFFYKTHFNNNKLLIPYLHILCFLLFVFYCLGFFFDVKFDFFDPILINKTINILLLSFSSFLFGYFFLNIFLKNKSLRINFFILKNNNTNIILYISSLYLIFFYLFDFLNNIKYVIFFKNAFLYLFVVSLAYFFVIEKHKLKKTIFLLLFILVMIIEASSSSIFFSIFTLLCFIFCLFFLNKKKLAIFALLFLFFLTFIFQFSKTHQRLQLSKANPKNNYEISILYSKSIIFIFKNLYLDMTNNTGNYGQYSEIYLNKEKKTEHFNGLKNRIFHSLNVFLIVVKKTPEEINYYYGKSYEGIIYKFVPRILLPSKPEELYGNFWGKRYEALLQSDNQTSWNFPVLAEFYANFGIMGCVFGMFLIGCFLRIISVPIINKNKNSADGNLISISIFFQFIYQEINLTLIIGNMFISLILTLIIIFAANKIFEIKNF